MLRGTSLGAIALLLVPALAGCLTPPLPNADAASLADLDPPAPGLKGRPVELVMPAGSSYVALWLNVTESDWTNDGGQHWLRLGFAGDREVRADAGTFLLYRVEDGEMDWTGWHTGTGLGAGSNGMRGEPAANTYVAVLAVDGLEAPAAVRFGIFDEFPDFTLEGEPQPPQLLAAGDGHRLSVYFDFAAPPFSDGPFVHNVDVSGLRVGAPAPAAVAGAGTRALSASHTLASPGVHMAQAHAFSFLGARVGEWAFEDTVDGTTLGHSGPLLATPAADVATPRVYGQLPLAAEAKSSFTLTSAELFPVTVFGSVSFPLDLAAHGLTLSAKLQSFGLFAAAYRTQEGCFVNGKFFDDPFCRVEIGPVNAGVAG